MNGFSGSALLALIGAVGAVASAVTAIIELWRASNARPRKAVVIGGVFAVCALLAGYGVYHLQQAYANLVLEAGRASTLLRIAPDFGLADLDDTNFYNAFAKIDLFPNPPRLPNTLRWYEMTNTGEQTVAPSPIVEFPNPGGYVSYESRLRSRKCGWTALVIKPRRSINMTEQGKASLVFVLQAAHEDTLEVTLRDTSGNADVRPLRVNGGWGGYILPLAQFSDVKQDQVRFVGIAHSCPFAKQYGGGVLDNVFKFALIRLG